MDLLEAVESVKQAIDDQRMEEARLRAVATHLKVDEGAEYPGQFKIIEVTV